MTREHHPVADQFPMLPEGELRDLAADIGANGLEHPIVLDEQGRILDGRNRYAACELANVEPTFELYDGDDPDWYALRVNINRRNLTKGGAALAATGTESFVTKERGEQVRLARQIGVSEAGLSKAKTVREFAVELVEDVMGGGSLEDAYKTARARKDADDEDKAQLAKLRDTAPDLIVLVENGMRDLPGALAEAGNRATVHEIDKIRNSDAAPTPSFAQRAEEGSITWQEAATLAEQWRDERHESIRRDQERIRSITAGWGALRTVADKRESSYAADVLEGLGQADLTELNRIISELKGG